MSRRSEHNRVAADRWVCLKNVIRRLSGATRCCESQASTLGSRLPLRRAIVIAILAFAFVLSMHQIKGGWDDDEITAAFSRTLAEPAHSNALGRLNF